VVVLRYYDDLSEAAIASVLGISVGTMKSTLSRALEQLRAELETQEDARTIEWMSASARILQMSTRSRSQMRRQWELALRGPNAVMNACAASRSAVLSPQCWWQVR